MGGVKIWHQNIFFEGGCRCKGLEMGMEMDDQINMVGWIHVTKKIGGMEVVKNSKVKTLFQQGSETSFPKQCTMQDKVFINSVFKININ